MSRLLVLELLGGDFVVTNLASTGDAVELGEQLQREFFFLNLSCMLAGPLEDILSCLNFKLMFSSSISMPVWLVDGQP